MKSLYNKFFINLKLKNVKNKEIKILTINQTYYQNNLKSLTLISLVFKKSTL